MGLHLQILEVDRYGDVRDPTIGYGGTAGQFGNIFHVRGAHAALVVDADVRENPVECHILLRVSMQQIVKL